MEEIQAIVNEAQASLEQRDEGEEEGEEFDYSLVSAVSTGDEGEWTTAQKDLLERWVLSPRNELNDENMTKFLMRDGILKLLCAYVTRRENGKSSIEVESTAIESATPVSFKWKREANPPTESFCHPSSAVSLEEQNEDEQTKISYHVMRVLCGLKNVRDPSAPMESFYAGMKTVEQPSPQCIKFQMQMCSKIVAYMFDAFHPESGASLYHVCKIIDVLLMFNANILVTSFIKNKHGLRCALEAIMDYIEHPCVADLFLTLICPVPTTAKQNSNNIYVLHEDTRKAYFRVISGMNVLLLVGQHIWHKDAPQSHKSAAAELLQFIVQKLAGISYGSEILDSLVRSVELLNGLILVACGEEHLLHKEEDDDDWGMSANTKSSGSGNKKKKKKGKKGGKGKSKRKKGSSSSTAAKQEKVEDEDNKSLIEHSLQRDAALDTLRFIVELSTKKVVPATIPKAYTSFAEASANTVECQLGSISNRLHSILQDRFDDLCRAISDPTSFVSKGLGSDVKHTSYVVKLPFSNYRLELMKLIVTCVEHNPQILLGKVSNANWKSLTDWFLEYPHCNLYHVQYRVLFMTLLRSPDHPALLYVLFDCGFLDRLIDSFSDEAQRKRENVSGHVLMLLNSIRLTLESLPPHHALVVRLQTNEKWKTFVTDCLVPETLRLLQPWKPSKPDMLVSHQNPSTRPDKENMIKSLVSGEQDLNIGLGGEFANELGFSGVVPYTPGMENKNRKKRGNRRQR